MIKSKLFDVLKCLSKEDLKKFGDYLNSPLFNKRKILHTLFSIYKKYHPEYEDRNLTKEKVFNKLLPGKKFSDDTFRNFNSMLLKHVEDFLSYLNYSGDPLIMKQHLLSEINHRNILTVFEKNFDEAVGLMEKAEQNDVRYFLSGYRLFHQKDLYNSIINKFSKDDIRTSEKNLIVFFILQFLEIQNYILFECRILNLDSSMYLNKNFTDRLMTMLPEDIKQMPQILIYYNALRLEQTSDKKYYDNLRSLLNSHGKLIDKEKHYNKYLDMIHYIKRTSNTQDIKTVKELFHLRKEIIEKDLVMENTVTNIFFLNLVRSALKLKEFDWVVEFIRKNESLLIPKYREITVDLSMAFLHFEKKEFTESLSHAAKVKYEDSYYSLEVKNLTARIYYEINDIELLLNFVSSYRMYLSKHRTLSKSETASHILFLNYMDKLIRIKEQKKYHKLDTLIPQIKKSEFVNKQWVLEKAQELDNEFI